jgi:hypothetical protein
MVKTAAPENPLARKQPSRASMLRAVASSTAVETGGDIQKLEQQLQQGKGRFRHITLAR